MANIKDLENIKDLNNIHKIQEDLQKLIILAKEIGATEDEISSWLE